MDIFQSNNQAAPPPPPPPPPPPVAPPPPPPPPPPSTSRNNPQQEKTTAKYRRVLWRKIPDNRLLNVDTIWTSSDTSPGVKRLSADYETLTDLFSTADGKNVSRKTGSREKRSNPSPSTQSDRKKQVTLLDTKQSMNTNIFLRQFKRPVKDLVKAIESCDTSQFSADQLKTLLRLLPEKDTFKKSLEENMRDDSVLDNADTFMVELMKVPSYQLRIECTMFMAETKPCLKEVSSFLLILDNVIKEIRNCASLPPILQLVLETGNFLNQGASYGNASGFSLSSLQTLFETKANKPGITLMHYVAMELEKQNPEMLDWSNQIPSLSAAKSISVDELVNKLKNCKSELSRLTEHVSNVDCEDLKEKMDGFFQNTKQDLERLDEWYKEVEKKSSKLALYLCETSNEFSLENCIEIITNFRDKFLKALKENEARQRRMSRRKENRIIPQHSHSRSGDAASTSEPVALTTPKQTNPMDDELFIREDERDDKSTPLNLGGDFENMTQRLRRRTRVNRARSDPGFTKTMEEELFKHRSDTPRYEFSIPSNEDKNSPGRVRMNSFLYPQTNELELTRRRSVTVEPESVDKNRNDDIRERIRRYKENSDIEEGRKRTNKAETKFERSQSEVVGGYKQDFMTRRSRFTAIKEKANDLSLEDVETDPNNDFTFRSKSRDTETSNSHIRTSFVSRRRRRTVGIVTEQDNVSSNTILGKLSRYTASTRAMNQEENVYPKSTQRQDDNKPKTMDSFSLQAEKALEDMCDVSTKLDEPIDNPSYMPPGSKSHPQIIVETVCDELVQSTSVNDPVKPEQVSAKTENLPKSNGEKTAPSTHRYPQITEKFHTENATECVSDLTSKDKTDIVQVTERVEAVKGKVTDQPSAQRTPKAKTTVAVLDPKSTDQSLKSQGQTKIRQSKSPGINEKSPGNIARKSTSLQQTVLRRDVAQTVRSPRPKSATPDITKVRSKTVASGVQKPKPVSSNLGKPKTSMPHARSDPNIFASSTKTNTKHSSLSLYRPTKRPNRPPSSASKSKGVSLRDNEKSVTRSISTPKTDQLPPSGNKVSREKQSTVRSKSFANPPSKSETDIRQTQRVAPNTIRSKSFVTPSDGRLNTRTGRNPQSTIRSKSLVKPRDEQTKIVPTQRVAQNRSSVQTDSTSAKTKGFLKNTASSASKTKSETKVNLPRGRSGSQNSSASSENASITSSKNRSGTREGNRTNRTISSQSAEKSRISSRGVTRPSSTNIERAGSAQGSREITRVRTDSHNSSTSSENIKTSPSKQKMKSVRDGATASLQPDKSGENLVKRRPPSSSRERIRPWSAYTEHQITGTTITRNKSMLAKSNKPIASQSFHETAPRSGLRTTATTRTSNDTVQNKSHDTESTFKSDTPRNVSRQTIKWLKVGDKSRQSESRVEHSRAATETKNSERPRYDSKKVGATSKQNAVPADETITSSRRTKVIDERLNLLSNTHAAAEKSTEQGKSFHVSDSMQDDVIDSTKGPMNSGSSTNPNKPTRASSPQNIPKEMTQNQNVIRKYNPKQERNMNSPKVTSTPKHPAANKAGLRRSGSVRPTSATSPTSSSGASATRSYSLRATSAKTARRQTESITTNTIAENTPTGKSLSRISKLRHEATSNTTKTNKCEAESNSGRNTTLTRTVLLRLQKLKKDSG